MNPAWWLAPMGGLLLGALLLAIHVWSKRRWFGRRVRRESCPLCHNPFAESLHEVLGSVTLAHRERLDRFQQRFARFEVRCHECGAIVICAEDGTPIKALVEEA